MSMKLIKRFGYGVAVMVASGAANAAVDTTAVTAELTSAGTAVATVGAAVLVVAVGVKVFKWVRAAL